MKKKVYYGAEYTNTKDYTKNYMNRQLHFFPVFEVEENFTNIIV